MRSVTLRRDGAEKMVTIEESAAMPPFVLMRFAGCNSPEAAKAMNGAELLVSREDAAPLRADEFYVEDLKGLAVFAAGDAMLGRITAVVEGGGGDLAEIRLNNGQLKLVPFRKEFFSGIDPEKGRVTLTNLWILE